ncbi:MAG: TIM barrel protein [Terrimonas sp.]|nr:TIM barrel protein [Terrimonas sp.]
MTIHRRGFLKQSSLAIGSAILLKHDFLFNGKKERVGLQLYSVRDEMYRDPAGTLEKVANMGYRYVEHANYSNRKFYGYSVREFKSLLDGLGLQMPSGHTVLNNQHWDKTKKEFTPLWKNTVEDAAFMGQHFVISPSMEKEYRSSYDQFMALMEIFNKSGSLCKQYGMKFGYHNHDFEFSEKLNGIALYDLILKNTDPGLVIQQLDTGNLFNGGARALEIVKQNPGRFQSLHVKDEIPVPDMPGKYESCILGKGIAEVKKVLDLVRKKSGDVDYIIEQEAYQGLQPIDCAREDLAVMKNWGF